MQAKLNRLIGDSTVLASSVNAPLKAKTETLGNEDLPEKRPKPSVGLAVY
jgi:hypothetical protein